MASGLSALMARRLVNVAALAGAVLLLAGCTGQLTGGGELTSAENPSSYAHFAVEYDGSSSPARLTGSYHDGSVRLRFDGVQDDPVGNSGPDPAAGIGVNCFAIDGRYVSQNSDDRGAGAVLLVACDAAQGNLPSLVSLDVETGPFAGYNNAGTLIDGNLTAHTS